MTEVAFPTITNGQDFNVAKIQAIEDAINAVLHSSTNPTIDLPDIVDEVVTARGTKASLGTRISVEHNADGTHNVAAANLMTLTNVVNAVQSRNLVANDSFIIWPAGDSAAPAHYVLVGAGASVARDTTNRKVGPFSAQVTSAAATASLEQYLVGSTEWANMDQIEGRNMQLGCWVLCSEASVARVGLNDGVATTYSSFHTGGGAWEFLPGTRQISGSATSMRLILEVATGVKTARFSGPTVHYSNHNTGNYVHRWMPTRCKPFQIVWSFQGIPSIGDHQREFSSRYPYIIKDVQCISKTAGSGAFTIDIEAGNGSSWNTIFSGAKDIVTSAKYGSVQPDGTYRYRTLNNGDNTTVTDALLRLNIDAVNGIISPVILVRGVQYRRQFAENVDYNQTGAAA